MSLSGALYNAFGGLTANARAAAIVSTNIANATTESYGRRSLDVSADTVGTYGGVRINGVTRHSDPVLMADRRLSDAQLGQGDVLLNYAKRLEAIVGQSGEAGSLTGSVAAFENALITAASNPASAQRLETVATTARTLALTLNRVADGVQESREQADRSIASQVETLNATLARVEQINVDLARASGPGEDVNALLDERQRLVDSISEIVPLRVVARERDEFALFTMAGAVLLDGRVNEVGFTSTATIEAGMTQSGGALSGLTIAGIPARSDDAGMFAGGSLAAQFRIRDELAVDAQAMLDGIARDLVERTGAGGPDATLVVTDPGLFTDAGAAFDPVNETGLASRITLNVTVQPGSAELWRLRDGLGSVAEGPVGDARLLQGIAAALTAATPPGSSALASTSRSFSDHVSAFSSAAAGVRVRFESDQVYLAAQNTALRESELAGGVDTDQELQSLMQIEQHYAANAKVMSVVDELMQRLLNI